MYLKFPAHLPTCPPGHFFGILKCERHIYRYSSQLWGVDESRIIKYVGGFDNLSLDQDK